MSVLLVDNEKIRELNSLYRGVDETTDVLAFSQSEGVGVPRKDILGDVVISLDKAQEVAKRFGRVPDKEILLYLIHGVLHLVGFEHNSKSKDIKKREKKLLEKIWKISEL